MCIVFLYNEPDSGVNIAPKKSEKQTFRPFKKKSKKQQMNKK